MMKEEELIQLVEERGVGIYPFKEVIDEIADYVQKTLNKTLLSSKSNKLTTTDNKVVNYMCYIVNIPKTITEKFTWINDLNISIEVRDTKDKETIKPLSGTGATTLHPTQKLVFVNNEYKLSVGDINIICYSVDKQLQPRTLYLNLFHEFNHDWENFNRLKKNQEEKEKYGSDEVSNGLWFTHYQLNYNNIVKGCKSNDENIRKFCNILYRLWIPDEFNALIASVYGDLKGLCSKSYKEDYKKLNAYGIYVNLKSYLNDLKTKGNLVWQELSTYHIVSIPPNRIESFKNQFITQSEYKLNDLFHRINRTASLYYENTLGNVVSLIGFKTVGNDSGILYEEYDNLSSGIDLLKENFDKRIKLEEDKYNALQRFKKLI